MFNFLRTPTDQLIIDNGRVFCPIRRQDTDIDLCAGCPRVRQIEDSGSLPFVRCRLEPAMVPGGFYV